MPKTSVISTRLSTLTLIAFWLLMQGTLQAQPEIVNRWDIHDPDRPQPTLVTPGTFSTQAQVGTPPSDAIVLFDGSDLSAWESDRGGAAKWKVENGYMEVVAGTGGVHTKQAFGDVQAHLEFASPNPPSGKGQDNGNSGLFFMGPYEVQVLNSYENETYPDGQAAALYGQYPPLVNASLPPGQWQVYDVIFRRPRFAPNGTVLSPAYVTVFHNGVLVQDHVELLGATANKARPPYVAHGNTGPIGLQDHDHPVRFRNIWVRPLE